MKLKNLMEAFGGRCFYCKRTVMIGPVANIDSMATKDHNVAKCRSGYARSPYLSSNEVLACFACNNAKNDMTGAEFVYFLRTGKIAGSYIVYIETRLSKRLRLNHAPAPPIAAE